MLNCEGYREGVDDLRCIVTLENRIAEAEKRVFDVPTGWDFDWYDRAREMIAQAIIGLDKQLK